MILAVFLNLASIAFIPIVALSNYFGWIKIRGKGSIVLLPKKPKRCFRKFSIGYRTFGKRELSIVDYERRYELCLNGAATCLHALHVFCCIVLTFPRRATMREIILGRNNTEQVIRQPRTQALYSALNQRLGTRLVIRLDLFIGSS